MKTFLRCVLYIVVLPALLFGAVEFVRNITYPSWPCPSSAILISQTDHPPYKTTTEIENDYMHLFVYRGKATIHYNESFRNYPHPFYVHYSSVGNREPMGDWTVTFPWGYLEIECPDTQVVFFFSNRPHDWWDGKERDNLGRSKPFFDDFVRNLNYLMPTVDDSPTDPKDIIIDPSVFLLYDDKVYRMSRGEAMTNGLL